MADGIDLWNKSGLGSMKLLRTGERNPIIVSSLEAMLAHTKTFAVFQGRMLTL